MKKITLSTIALLLLSFMLCLVALNANLSAGDRISGTVQAGYRILTIPDKSDVIDFTVYRGDYLKFRIEDDTRQIPQLSIPALTIRKQLNGDLQSSPYFKMKAVGTYPFTIGDVTGTINVIEYEEAQYQALTATESVKLIENISPVILDVRTQAEYADGHLKNALLIPIQEMQQRLSELTTYQHENILIYCATGNRSTVAAKILIDNGFTRIYNMREGVHVWAQHGYPIVL